ncbi:hypothetical protein HZC32_02105 [Candidatus Woesearchaeota archaeon]|nr:hypothetical protein [Candidatus Woesearchaeota archaeon]
MPKKRKAKTGVKGYLKQVKAKFKHAEAKVAHAIKKNPEKAALIAAGIGAAIGAAAAAAIMYKRKK